MWHNQTVHIHSQVGCESWWGAIMTVHIECFKWSMVSTVWLAQYWRIPEALEVTSKIEQGNKISYTEGLKQKGLSWKIERCTRNRFAQGSRAENSERMPEVVRSLLLLRLHAGVGREMEHVKFSIEWNAQPYRTMWKPFGMHLLAMEGRKGVKTHFRDREIVKNQEKVMLRNHSGSSFWKKFREVCLRCKPSWALNHSQQVCLDLKKGRY